MTPIEEKLLIWKSVTSHVISLILTLGFFGIVFLALLGQVNLGDPTTATFVGTVTGYAIAKLDRPLAWYYYLPREAEKINGHLDKV